MSVCGGGRIPGPSYRLATLTGYENHDYTKNRGPAYSLGLRPNERNRNITPGPYNVGNVDRNGRYPYAGWTMESRAGVQVKTGGPSPLSYAPEKVKPYTPAYSLGLKINSRPIPFGPSPAEYFPQYPPQSGFTFGTAFKNFSKLVPPGPQPAVPTDTYKQKAPAYSLGLKGRAMFPDNSAGPGPKYYPGKVGNQVPHAYSFGLRHGKCSPPMITYEDNN